MSPLERVLEALRSRGFEPKQSGAEWTSRCPAHVDQNPSLNVAAGDAGGAVVICHAGCATPDVVAAIGLTMQDLMPPGVNVNKKGRRGSAKGNTVDTTPKTIYADAWAAIAVLEQKRGPHSEMWKYHNKRGKTMGAVLRWDVAGGKIIRPISRKGDGWITGAISAPRPLYNLPKLATAKRVYVMEGEKAAEAGRALGIVATTSMQGCKSAGKTDWGPLAGKDVVILPDHNKAGEGYAADVLAMLGKLDPAPTVKIVRLAERWTELPKGGDLADVPALEHLTEKLGTLARYCGYRDL